MNLLSLVNLFYSDFLKKNRNKGLLVLFLLVTIIYFCFEVIGISYIVQQLMKKPDYKLIINSIVLLLSLVIFNALRSFLENIVSVKLRISSRVKFLNGIIDRFNESYKDIKIGDTVSRIMAVTLDFAFGFNLFIKIMIPRIVTMIICCTAIFFINKALSIILIVNLLSMIIFCYSIFGLISREKKKAEDTYYSQFDQLSNKYNNLLNTYINNESSNLKNNITKLQDIYSKKVFKADNTLVLNTSILKFILSFFLVMSVIYISYNFNSIKVGMRTFLGIIIVFYISAALSLSGDSSDFLAQIAVANASSKGFSDLFKKTKTGGKQIIKKGDISISNLSFSYNQNNNPVLSNINLKIKDKEKVAIMGRSGSGKSTLAKLMLKLYSYQGSIRIDNTDIQALDTITIRDKVSYVNQRTELLEETVLDNIRFGSNSSSNEVISILNKYQLQEVFSGLGKGVHEQCLIDGKNLSLGMQKVIILVRGVLKSKNSLVIFFDEPLAALDQKSRKKVIKMIMTECSEKTIIVITHDPEIVPYMDRIYNINEMNS